MSQTLNEWRKAERNRLIEERLAIPAETRSAMSVEISKSLDLEIGDFQGRTVSLYWPFRGEPDMRPWMNAISERGGTVALPIVVKKAQPLIFKAYKPGDRLKKGIWNIPIPADGAPIMPDVVIAPVVGFDAENYRLGYGGGFFDRTLAVMPKNPLVIGIGYESAQIPSIRPQPYDIVMDMIVTERGRFTPKS
jgi:5-formyltetrahydrofolate cyclo-ligase